MKTDYECVNSNSFKHKQKFGIKECAVMLILALILTAAKI